MLLVTFGMHAQKRGRCSTRRENARAALTPSSSGRRSACGQMGVRLWCHQHAAGFNDQSGVRLRY